jgi:hypothetical protein
MPLTMAPAMKATGSLNVSPEGWTMAPMLPASCATTSAPPVPTARQAAPLAHPGLAVPEPDPRRSTSRSTPPRRTNE